MSEVEPQLLPDYGRRRGNIILLRLLDGMTYTMAIGGALVMLGLLLLLLARVFQGALPAIRRLGWEFFVSRTWDPAISHQFGVLPAIYGTLLTSVLAMVMAVPVSIGSALFLVKIAPKIRIPVPNLRRKREGAGSSRWAWVAPRPLVTVASFLIELLAAIPSIAYGFWAVAVLVPFMQKLQPFISETSELSRMPVIGPHMPSWNVGLNLFHLPWVGYLFEDSGSGYNSFTCGIILAIMVTPIITAIVRDVLSVAPPELEQGALGLGATWWQATRMLLGYSKMGIFGGVILGFARAIGETMAVTMVIANMPTIGSVFDSGETIASQLASQFREADPVYEKAALIYAALVLLIITMLINGAARLMVMQVARKAAKK